MTLFSRRGRPSLLGAGVFALLCLLGASGLRAADVMDDCSAMRRAWDVVFLDLYGNRLDAAKWGEARKKTLAFRNHFHTAGAKKLWQGELPSNLPEPADAARVAGAWQGRIEHALALEMIAAHQEKRIEEAKAWRALIHLPKYADAIQGALALQTTRSSQRDAATQLLAREYLVWKTTLIREKSDYLKRLIEQDRATPELFAARAAEIDSLAEFPARLLQLVDSGLTTYTSTLDLLLAGGIDEQSFAEWKDTVQSSLPSLLTDDEAANREYLLIKLLKLVPMEYQAGVRDGQITVPLEYREAQQFTIQARQIIDELQAPWQRNKAEVLKEGHGAALVAEVESLETEINHKAPLASIQKHASGAMNLLEDHFGVSLRRAGKASEVVAETLLDIRTLLGDSLVAAKEGDWKEAERLRLEAYTNFDLEIEIRTLPRDPELAMEAERAFLDGTDERPGIKATLDARAPDERLSLAYENAIDLANRCGALLQMNLSPATAVYTTVTVVMREGLEAVVILAAILAGLRGAENRRTRRRIGLGAFGAILASALTFILSRMIIGGFADYGERLEAVVSVLAVIVLLIVTNWIFHKMYWVNWNAKLRHLTKAVNEGSESRSTALAMIGVGFLTIYREGFETVLFLQSLLLEAGLRPVLTGLLVGGALVCACGGAVFVIGAKLPYRKMLVFTGILVVTVLVTFLGSTVRLFQTVGWLPVHPITGLDIPPWAGTWFGLYPSWEGILIPPLGLAYIGAAWLWVKWKSKRSAKVKKEKAQQSALQPQTAQTAGQTPPPSSKGAIRERV